MGDEKSDPQIDTETLSLEMDDVPTERIPLENIVKPETDPQQVGVIDPTLAASIRAEHGDTMADEDRFTFVGTVDSEGRIVIPERLRAAGALEPGDEYLIQVQKIN